MAKGRSRPLLVAGVAGGVGTSTWVRALRSSTALPIHDVGVYQVDGDPGDGSSAPRSAMVDVLVTSNTAAATGRLGHALATCPRLPILVVMHTVAGSNGTARAHLRKAQPHITRKIDIAHQPLWLEMEEPPGKYLPRGWVELVRSLPATLQQMYASPPRMMPARPTDALPRTRHTGTSWSPGPPGSARPPHVPWPPGNASLPRHSHRG